MIRPLKYLLFAVLFGGFSVHAAEPELVLAGGSLKLCSGLSLRDCDADVALPPGRTAARYSLARQARERALDPLLWPRRSSVFMQSTGRQLRAAAQLIGAGDHPERSLLDALEQGCSGCGKPVWRQLDDHERGALLSALELPQMASGERLREQVSLAGSSQPGGVEVIHAFVAAAARRSTGRPRIAIVSASALDSFDPVDFYLEVFRQAGADAVWWPVDAALASVVFASDRDCTTLDQARIRELGMSGRAQVYPDLALQQHAWCEHDDAARLPANIDGVFFTGGDQWRLRRAFVDAEDQPNPWLTSLRAAFEAGQLAIGGTSAGTAVQSGAGMLSNGSSRHAVRHPPLEVPPPVPGCHRADGCNGVDDEQLTLWPAGGLGLAIPFLLDTHFSERAREWRMLRALAALPTQRGIGVDETSAIRIRRMAPDVHELEAVGARGAWLFEPGARGCARLSGHAHYLAPGAIWRLDAHEGLHPVEALPPHRGGYEDDQPLAPSGKDPFAAGAIRHLAWTLASEPAAAEQVATVDGGRLQLEAEQDVRVWRSPRGVHGIVGMRFRFDYTDSACATR